MEQSAHTEVSLLLFWPLPLLLSRIRAVQVGRRDRGEGASLNCVTVAHMLIDKGGDDVMRGELQYISSFLLTCLSRLVT